MKKITFLIILLTSITNAQTDTRIYDIVNNVTTERIKKILLSWLILELDIR